ncbi:hypothetical protein V7122_02355 [Bacillus sp. JJ1532]|uniref:hypothetical protein n=1 Tax=Bacillus sp. JJ1532 TaxID=3122958 RepID=UPI00300055B2
MIENPMVIDRLWNDQKDPEVVGECEGCHEDIYEGDDIYDFDGGWVHQDSDCCQQYIANMSMCKTAG